MATTDVPPVDVATIQQHLKDDVQKLNDISEMCKTTETTLNQHLDDLNGEIQRLTSENDEYKKRMASCKESKDASELRFCSANVCRKLDAMEEILEKATAENNEYQTRNETMIDQHQQEVQALKAELHNTTICLEKKNSEIMQRYEEKENELRTLTEEFEDEVNKFQTIIHIYKSESRVKERVVEHQQELIAGNKTIIEQQQQELQDLNVELQNTRASLENKNSEIMQRCEKEKENENELRMLSEKIENEVNKLQTTIHIHEIESRDKERVVEHRTRQIQKLQDDVKCIEHQLKFQQHENKECLRNIESLREEKQELIARLRIHSGFRRISTDVAICVLNDENRPTKLAEAFATLFDSEWKAIFETITYKDDKMKIHDILDILKRAYQLSQESSQRHRSSIMHSFTTIALGSNTIIQASEDDCVPGRRPQRHSCSQESADDDSNSREGEENMREISTETTKLTTEHLGAVNFVRFFFEDQLAPDFEKTGTDIILHTLTEEFQNKQVVTKFILNCINICWKMCMHDPPVHIKFQEVTDDMAFDTNIYKCYQNTGKRVSYVVWPPVFLHEGGPLLEKGVAEGRE